MKQEANLTETTEKESYSLQYQRHSQDEGPTKTDGKNMVKA